MVKDKCKSNANTTSTTQHGWMDGQWIDTVHTHINTHTHTHTHTEQADWYRLILDIALWEIILSFPHKGFSISCQNNCWPPAGSNRHPAKNVQLEKEMWPKYERNGAEMRAAAPGGAGKVKSISNTQASHTRAHTHTHTQFLHRVICSSLQYSTSPSIGTIVLFPHFSQYSLTVVLVSDLQSERIFFFFKCNSITQLHP